MDCKIFMERISDVFETLHLGEVKRYIDNKEIYNGKGSCIVYGNIDERKTTTNIQITESESEEGLINIIYRDNQENEDIELKLTPHNQEAMFKLVRNMLVETNKNTKQMPYDNSINLVQLAEEIIEKRYDGALKIVKSAMYLPRADFITKNGIKIGITLYTNQNTHDLQVSLKVDCNSVEGINSQNIAYKKEEMDISCSALIGYRENNVTLINLVFLLDSIQNIITT